MSMWFEQQICFNNNPLGHVSYEYMHYATYIYDNEPYSVLYIYVCINSSVFTGTVLAVYR